MAASPPVRDSVCNFGWKAPGFALPATDGRTFRLSDIAGPKGTLVMFICNHCPYVTGAIDRILADARTLQAMGIGVAAICANDAAAYPDDSFPMMQDFAERHGFAFPYLHDETQEVARAWGAACTPDFFGLNAEGELQYRGRLDAGGRTAPPPGARRELVEAMRQIAETGEGPRDQVASMGCSIKWKAA